MCLMEGGDQDCSHISSQHCNQQPHTCDDVFMRSVSFNQFIDSSLRENLKNIVISCNIVELWIENGIYDYTH